MAVKGLFTKRTGPKSRTQAIKLQGLLSNKAICVSCIACIGVCGRAISDYNGKFPHCVYMEFLQDIKIHPNMIKKHICLNIINTLTNIFSYKSVNTLEIYPGQVKLTVLEDSCSVYIFHKNQYEYTSSALLRMHPSQEECCSQNGHRALVPVPEAVHSFFLQEQNNSDLEQILRLLKNTLLRRLFGHMREEVKGK